MSRDFSGYGCYTLQQKMVVSRTTHRCGECGCEIKPGMTYELYKGVQDGSIFTCKTCPDCVSIRQAFFDRGIAMFGAVLDEVREQVIYELGGEVSAECILPLTVKARARIFSYIEEAWSEE